MPKNSRLKKYRFRYWHLLIVAGVILLIVVFFGIYNTYKQDHPRLADAKETAEMKRFIIDTKNKITDDRGEWRDVSKCTIIEPRKLGDKRKTYCRTEFERIIEVSSQQEVNTLIKSQHDVMDTKIFDVSLARYPTFPKTQADKYDIKSYDFSIKKLSQVKCSIDNTYITETAKTYLKQSIGCMVDTFGAFYEPIDKV